MNERSQSPIGKNVLYCRKRHNCTCNNFLLHLANKIINLNFSNSIDDTTFSTANLLSELLSVIDGLSDIFGVDFTKDELSCNINIVFTS